MKRYELAVMACGHEIEVLVGDDLTTDEVVAETLYDVSQDECPDCQEANWRNDISRVPAHLLEPPIYGEGMNAAMQGRIDRVRALFMEKLAQRYPNHPWLKLERQQPMTLDELDDLTSEDQDPYQTMMDRARKINERNA